MNVTFGQSGTRLGPRQNPPCIRRLTLMSLTKTLDLLSPGRVVVLSGAGLSTESGIPDYRGPSGAATRNHQPMTFQTFTQDPLGRRRYWARSHLGWDYISNVRPNAGHQAVAALEHRRIVSGVITQNVDGLHQAAGSRAVIDLHGRLDRVSCLRCSASVPRSAVQRRLAEANPTWAPQVRTINPDGDAELTEDEVLSFQEVNCDRCGGILKPDVVYFGENVPTDRVERSYSLVDAARVLLVLGSSLTVFSGRRFAARAHKNGIPVVIINEGPTRADDIAAVKIESRLGPTLETLLASII
jgi:NAD-dependent SIR2 family protein deacetylase